MKKFYAFLAAALMSVSVFAAKDVVPSDEVLADYYTPGQVCVCIYVPNTMNCYDVVLVGTYNDWTADAAQCAKFVAVEGYEDWYVVAVDDDGLNAKGEPYESLQEKPVMLDGDGKFSWDYQVGTATYIRGGVSIVEGGVPGEIDLKTYGTDAPNVFTVDGWKNNPCTAVYHNYTVQVISDGCGGLAVPFIIGGMNNWVKGGDELQIDVDKTQELMVPVYSLTFKAAEGTEYQLLSGLRDPETGLIDSTAKPDWYDDAYLQILVDGVWQRYEPTNSKLGTEVFVGYDLRLDTIRWARCAPAEPAEIVEVSVKLPAENFPEEGVEIIGTFDDWAGTAMAIDGDVYKATIEAKASQYFKFRSAGKWPGDQGGTEIEIYRDDDEYTSIQDNELVFGQLWEGEEGARTLYLDLSDPEVYRWKARAQGIENVVLTEKAQKVVVDGVLYIVRDNKMFNVQGSQVR
ncbi:MAG: hypothetical protein IJS57_05125 [Paludibacteraceae bacterium]|nr:hypothetical protein [Paludibacteraceae bacterium]